ncbi:M48 family metallopeptidase [Dongia sedimenti]|uniref:M48 family metallopeptidase n=1 Tax=Dongia sedimenti TaxID=3064282 RepID=A0ABU0YF93_9PROT|nr:M48 family metallopeptidase [Rhodospirillaceae bacterium R-7]
MQTSIVILIVALAILAQLGFELWLDGRQIRWIRGHRDSVPAAFAGRIALEEHRKSVDYAIERLQLSRIDSVVGSILTVLLLLGGLFAFYDRSVTALAGSGYLAGLLLVGVLMLTYAVVELPFSVWRTFKIEQKFGFNHTTPGLFIADMLKGAAVGIVLGAPFVLAIDFILRNVGEYWWLAGWGLYVGFNLVMLLIIPTFVMPLFNKLEPIDDSGLRGRIETLLKRCGFQSKGLFKMDASKRSGHGNAFFTGFGPSKRIVLFDTIIASLSAEEIEAVLAHELGHFKLRHIVKRMLTQLVVSLIGFAVIGWLIAQPWFAASFGLDTAMPLSPLILALLVLPAFTGWFRGFSNWRSRVHEFEADAYAAGQTNGADLASALLKLHKDNAAPSTTDPVYSTFKHSHPPTAERIARLQTA